MQKPNRTLLIMRKSIFFILAGLLLYFFLNSQLAGSLTRENDFILVAAASNLQFAMNDIVTVFENNNPRIKVKIVYGSSGNFFNQILNGAPFDLYFSADPKYPYVLKKKKMGNDVIIYAMGQIVLMTRIDSGIKIQNLGIKSLLHGKVKKIAIANPAHAPYGRVAESFLKRQHIYEKLKTKLVMGENISQASQFVESGAAEIGIIALSLAIKAEESGNISYWKIPAETYPNIEQGLIVLKGTKKQYQANKFIDFVQGRNGKSILRKYGFNVPGE